MDEPSDSLPDSAGSADCRPSARLTDFGEPVVQTAEPFPAPEVSVLEFSSIILLVVLADITIYSGRGYAGYAVFLAMAPLLIVIGARKRRFGWQTVIVSVLTLGAAVRLVWCGNALAFALGLVLLSCVSISLCRRSRSIWFGYCEVSGLLLPAGGAGLMAYDGWLKATFRRWIGVPTFTRLLAYLMPPIVGLTFLTIFILANPDVVQLVSRELAALAESFQTWISELIGSPARIPFWMAIAWLSIGLLRPLFVDQGAAWIQRMISNPRLSRKPNSISRSAIRFEPLLIVPVCGLSRFRILDDVVCRTFPAGSFTTFGICTDEREKETRERERESAAWLTVALAASPP